MKGQMIPELLLSLKDGYNGKAFLQDCIAGIIIGIIALPLSIALAIASGAAPALGLITAIFAGGIAALTGGSRTQISGPTGAFIVIVFGIITKFGIDGLIMATFMAGIFIVVMGILRLGKFVKYIPLPVIIGFTAGIAVTIFIGQLNDFLGLGIKDLTVETIPKFVYTMKNLGAVSWQAMIMGTVAVLIIVFVPKLQKVLPGPLTAIIVCTLLNLLLPTKCVTLGDIFGTVKVDIRFSVKFFDVSKIISLLVPALTIAFLAAIESLLSAAVADSMTSTKHNPNMELIGQGCANIASSLFGGLPATGAIARTSANIKSGGKTPVSAVVHSIFVLIASFFLMPYARYIPMTVFAAVLIVVCYNMLNIKAIAKILKTLPLDIILMTLTFVLTVIFNLIVSILVCTSLSLIYQLYRKYIKKRRATKEITSEGIKLKGNITYMNYGRLIEIGQETITLDLDEVDEIDATFTDFLIRKSGKNLIKINKANKKITNKLTQHKEFAYLLAEE